MIYVARVWKLTTVAEPRKEEVTDLDSMWEVLLHNDDESAMEHVTICLMKIFDHSLELAVKIMWEAHHRGSAVAEVEERDAAVLHCAQLQSCGLKASVRAI